MEQKQIDKLITELEKIRLAIESLANKSNGIKINLTDKTPVAIGSTGDYYQTKQSTK